MFQLDVATPGHDVLEAPEGTLAANGPCQLFAERIVRQGSHELVERAVFPTLEQVGGHVEMVFAAEQSVGFLLVFGRDDFAGGQIEEGNAWLVTINRIDRGNEVKG